MSAPPGRPGGVTFTSFLLRHKARGAVTLRSAGPAAQPLVNCNFFGDRDDLRLTMAALETARALLATEPFKSKIAQELLPGADVIANPEALERYCGQTVKTNYHPVGTLRMGSDSDPGAMVGPDLTVRGIDRLRHDRLLDHAVHRFGQYQCASHGDWQQGGQQNRRRLSRQ
ncbi:MAG: GMC family oxidoreductase [Candidatus Devosia euplotis]|nr:GMC family oxidoreductase [Candidatus Devosia euplotis]